MKPRFILALLGFDPVSTVMASILVACDVVLWGSFLLSSFFIPLCFLGAIIKLRFSDRPLPPFGLPYYDFKDGRYGYRD